ncbi:2-acylglycerol O-acyltransferase 1 [Halotydeus destructor]|nr:2-acylglycerol O-acyltransferase 1 [Halotydeus destructor]
MPKVLGIDFAPLALPVERRLQTLAILYFMAEFALLGPLTVGLFLWLLFTPYYWVPCVYAAWYVYDRQVPNQGGRKWTPSRHWRIWNYYRDYFPIKMVKTADIDPDRNYIFTTHPHGIICSGIALNFGSEANRFSQLFPGLKAKLLTLEEQFKVPFHRELFMLCGACSATRASMEWLLTREGKGNALVLIPGGAIEALDAVPGKFEVFLARRKGFCRMALKYGADLVPVLSFGENEVFQQYQPEEGSSLSTFQRRFTKFFRFSPPLFHGRGVFQYSFGLLPYRKPITTVVGRPIAVTKVDGEPTSQQIDQLHETYCKVLKEFYDEHKSNYGFEGVPLNIK